MLAIPRLVKLLSRALDRDVARTLNLIRLVPAQHKTLPPRPAARRSQSGSDAYSTKGQSKSAKNRSVKERRRELTRAARRVGPDQRTRQRIDQRRDRES